MKNKLCLFVCLISAVLLQAQPLFEENFEDPEKLSFSGIQLDADNPSSGEYCAHLVTAPGAKSDVSTAVGKKVIPVEPGQWYRLSVRTRNDIKNGELKFGLLESRSSEKRVSRYYDWRWKAVSLNIMDWRTNVMEFKTGKNTKGVILHIRTESMFSGSSWWDDIRLEKFEKKFPPVEICPFRAAVTFTDIPTKSAYALTKGKRGVITQNDTDYLWETLDLAKEKIEILYRDLQKDSLLKISMIHGAEVRLLQEKKLTGNGTVAIDAGLGKLPEGVYRFRAELFVNGQKISTQEKELWRIDSRKIAPPEHEKILKASVGKDRQRLVNGKIFNPCVISWAPMWGLYSHYKKYCKPDAETYFHNLQEQFGQDLFYMWSWRGPAWDTKKREFVKKAIADYREYLDFLQRMNCYGRIHMVITPYKKEKPYLEDIRMLVRGVKDHPALLEWFFDEPEVQRYSPEFMKKIYDVVHEEDPDHLVDINLCQPDKFHKYAPCSDIASFDIYPFPNECLIETQKRTKALLKAFPTAPFDSYVQVFNFRNMDMPSFDQIRASFLLDRVNGSHGLLAFAWAQFTQGFLTDLELQSYYRAIVFMFRRLEPVLRNRSKTQIAVKSSHEYVVSGTYDDGKDQVLIVVNISGDTPAEVSFVHPASEGEDFFDGNWRTAPVNGKYSFNLAPNGTKVLRLKTK